MKLGKFGLVGLLVFATVSCASVKLVTRSLPADSTSRGNLSGKSIGIIPFAIDFDATRVAIDLRDVKLTVNGQEIILQERYIARDEDISLGKIGILDVNILTKAGTKKEPLSSAATDILKGGLSGTYDYHVGFLKGLGEDNMGELSNRPIDYDRSVFPPVVIYTGAAASPYYSTVTVLPAGTKPEKAGTDLVLTGNISISNEVVEILEPPDKTGVSIRTSPEQGQYYLTMKGFVTFTLSEVKTGKVIATEASKSEWPVRTDISQNILLPVQNKDAAAFAKYFRTVDLSPYALDTVKQFVPLFLPLLSPYFVNTTHQVAEEK
jgi:hypothetical protein